MILYNLTINIDKDVEREWLLWMKHNHIPEIIKTGHFHDHKIYRLLLKEETGITYALQLFAESLTKVAAFEKEFADRFQTELYMKYPNQVGIFKTMMKEV